MDLSYNLAAENERRTRAVAMRKRAPASAASAIKTREEIAVEEIQASEPEPIRGRTGCRAFVRSFEHGHA